MKISKKTFFAFSVCLFLPFMSLQAHDDFPFSPPENFELDSAYIALHHPVTTENFEAQSYFDQGLSFIYAFNHDAAYWSFLRASQEDPNLAMAYWGMALALGPNINMDITPERQKVAYEAIQKALKLADRATPNERDYIQALAKRYTNAPNPDLKQLALAYKNAMQQVTQKYPDDLDAVALYAESALDLNPWHQWTTDGQPREGTLEIVAVLEDALKKDPEHLGANHYYIHAVEASNHPERALMNAEILPSLYPESGHILHMPSHIYILVGDYRRAVISNEEAVLADRAYIRKYGMRGIYPLHYLSHNYYFLSRAYAMEGNFQDALKAAQELVEFYVPRFKMMKELEYYAPSSLFVLMRFHKWKELLEVPAPPSDMKITTALWHFTRGIAFAGLNQIPQAQEEQKKFLQEKSNLPSDTNYGYNKVEPILQIAAYLLEAKIAEKQKQSDRAASLLRQAVSIQDNLNYNEPPDWSFPVRESLGGVLLRNKQYKEAEQAFREDLDRHPRNGRALFGLLTALKEQNRPTDAFWVQQAFRKAWKYSTEPLSVDSL